MSHRTHASGTKRGTQPRTGRSIPGLWYVVLVAITVLASHGPALMAPLQFDDIHQIRNNPAMSDPESIGRFFADPWVASMTGHNRSYRPLLFMTFLMDGTVGGGSPLPYRVTSLVLLIAFALIVGRFVRKLLPELDGSLDFGTARVAGAVAALVVASHPILGESVLMATSRSSLLYGLFGLWALVFLIPDDPPEAVRSAGAALLTVLALLSKESAVTLGPLAVLVAAMAHRSESPLRWIRRSLPVLVPVAVYVIFYKSVYPTMGSGGEAVPAMLQNTTPQLAYPAQGGTALLGYVRLMLFPWGMAPDHPVPVPTGVAALAGYAVWPIFLVTAGLAWIRGAGGRIVGAGMWWFTIALMPVLTLVPLNTPLAEHRATVAVALPFGVVGYLLTRISRPRLRVAGTACLIIVLAALSFAQARAWVSPVSLWRHSVETEPMSARSWGALAEAERDAGDVQSAKRSVETALRLNPYHPGFLATAVSIELMEGDLAAAGDYIERGLAADENMQLLHIFKVEHLARTGRIDQALQQAEVAIEMDPGASAAWNSKGNVLLLLGRTDEAADAYARAVALDPENRRAEENLARLDGAP